MPKAYTRLHTLNNHGYAEWIKQTEKPNNHDESLDEQIDFPGKPKSQWALKLVTKTTTQPHKVPLTE